MDVGTVRRLAERHPEYLQDAAALLMAARTGRVDVVELLLKLGSSITSPSAPEFELIAEGLADDRHARAFGLKPH